jgi:phospholipase C
LSDNFHQSVHGGTYSNHVMLGIGDAIFWNDGNGNPAAPATTDISNPDPLPGTVNTYTIDGHFSACTVGGVPQPGGREVLSMSPRSPIVPSPTARTATTT